MRLVAPVALLGTALVAAPALADASPATSALLAVVAGVALAAVVSEHLGPLSVALGALGALAHTAVAPSSPELAGAVLVACVYGARVARARSPRARLLHAAAAALAGGAAALVASRFADGPLATRAAAALVAGVLASAALAFPVDDVVAFALAQLSSSSPEPSRTTLLRAAMLRRRTGALPDGLPARAAENLERAWRALIDTGRARVTATGASADLLDARIHAHVAALDRLYTAAGELTARAAGLNDRALTAARMEGEAIEAEVAALAEVGAESVPPATARAAASAEAAPRVAPDVAPFAAGSD